MTPIMGDLPEQLREWQQYNFPDRTKISAALGLAEEVGEVCRAVLKQDQGIRGTFEEWQVEIGKEISDVAIKLCDVANACGINLDNEIWNRWQEVRIRDYVANPNGHGISRE